MGLGAIIANVLEFVRREAEDGWVTDVKADPGDGDVVTAIHGGQAGDDSFPLTTDQAICVRAPGTNRWVVVGYLDPVNEPMALEGERRLYARSPEDGSVVATLWLREDATAQIVADMVHLGEAPGAAPLSRDDHVQTELSRLKSELSAFKSTFDAHIHVTTATVGPSATVGVIAPTTTAFPAPADPGETACEKVSGT